MKLFLRNLFGIFGIALYYVLSFIIRIPVFVFLLVYILVGFLVLDPLFKMHLTDARWFGELYDWYRGD